MKVGKLILKRLCLLGILVLAIKAYAEPARLTADNMAQPPSVQAIRLSPSGKQFAIVFDSKGKIALMTRTTAGRQPLRALLARDRELLSVDWVGWAGEERLLVRVTLLKSHESHWLAIPIDGGPVVTLTSPKTFASVYSAGYTDAWPVGAPYDGGRHVLMAASGATELHSPDVYEIDLQTGARRIIQPAIRKVDNWISDAARQAWVGMREDGEQVEIVTRRGVDQDWKTLWRFRHGAPDSVYPLALGPDANTLYVYAFQNGRRAIFAVKLDDPALPLQLKLASPDQHLPTLLVIDPVTKLPVGVSDAARRRAVYWEPAYQALMASVDQALPNRRNLVLQLLDDGEQYLLVSEAAGQASQYFVGNRKSGRLDLIAEERPDLDPAQLTPGRDVTLRTEHGMELSATLLRPHSASTAGPAVVLVRGPWYQARRFDPFAQLLASHGITVLEVGMRNYQTDPFKAPMAFKYWLKDSYQDVALGVQWLVEQGLADQRRICAAGDRIEAHAVLLAAARAPGSLQCVSLWNPIVDPLRWGIANFELPDTDGYLDKFRARIQWEDELRDVAPLRETQSIKSFVYLAVEDVMGVGFARQASDLEVALRRADKPLAVDRISFDSSLAHQTTRHERELERIQRISVYLFNQLATPQQPTGSAQ